MSSLYCILLWKFVTGWKRSVLIVWIEYLIMRKYGFDFNWHFCSFQWYLNVWYKFYSLRPAVIWRKLFLLWVTRLAVTFYNTVWHNIMFMLFLISPNTSTICKRLEAILYIGLFAFCLDGRLHGCLWDIFLWTFYLGLGYGYLSYSQGYDRLCFSTATCRF